MSDEVEKVDEASQPSAPVPEPSPTESGASASSDADPIEAAWAQVEASWESAEAHKKFLVLCDSFDRLAEAGRRYRAVKDADPKRRVEAEKRIEELLGLAMVRVRVDKVEPGKVRSRVEWIALGVSIVLVSAAVVSMLRMLGH
ncbi:MAG: hypothetical protein J0L92_34560 [Deltaproteobacteria bacterium]|nr:hypothetical protein [Deltaproteobacteria bacterium]